MENNKLEIIEWLINEASDNQIDGLIEFVKYKDINYCVEKLIDDEEEYSEWLNEIKEGE